MSLAVIFPGQGSQSVGMGKDLFDNSAQVRELFEQASEILKEDMQQLCFEENAKLNLTQYTQPAILLVSYSVFALAKEALQQKGIAFGLGHSLGEFSALCASGALSFQKAIALVHQRGILMERACKAKTAAMMVVLGLDDDVLEEFCQKKRNLGLQVWCANYNADGQVVLGGVKEDLQGLEVELKGLGAKRALMLSISIASHCPILEGMCEDFKALLQDALGESFAFSVVSNVSARPYNTKESALELLANQLVKPVLYKQSIKENAAAIDGFVECGGNVLKGLNKRLSPKETLSLQTYAEIQEFLQRV